MRFRLRQPYRLRSWRGLPRVLLDADRLALTPLSEEEFACLELCDGSVDLTLPTIPDDTRQAAANLARRGIIEPCAPGEGIAPEQAHRSFPNRFVRLIHWSVTGRCNYHCRHCLMDAGSADAVSSIAGGGLEPSLHEIEAIVDQIAACGVPAVALTGGEPLLREDFGAIAELLNRRGIRVAAISTNGSLVSEGLLDTLEGLGHHPQFILSFDGVGHHDWLRGVPGAEAAAERAIRLLARRGFRAVATLTAHSGNVDSIVETALALSSWGASELDVSLMCDEGRWSEGAKGRAYRSLRTAELAEALIAAIPAYYEAGRARGRLPLERLRLGPMLTVSASHPSDFRITVEYPPGKRANYPLMRRERLEPYLSVEGRLMPSMVLAGTEFAEVLGGQPFPLLSEVPLREILSDSPFLEYVGVSVEDYLRENPACAACPHFPACLGGSRVNAILRDPAHPLAPDPLTCELFRDGWVERTRAVATEAARRFAEDGAR